MNIEIEIEHGADIASGVDIEGITQYVLEQEGCPATTESPSRSRPTRKFIV